MYAFLIRVAPIAIAASLAGCAELPADPYTKTTSTRAVERSPARTPQSPAPTADAASVARSFAEEFINWKFDELPSIKRALGRYAAGTLAAQLRRDAETATTEISRRASNQANTGTVAAVSAQAPHVLLIVTRETAHLGDAHTQVAYMVYRATVARVGKTYKLVKFESLS